MEKENITIKKATYFVSTIQATRTDEDGNDKNITEQYAVDAISFGEAEDKTYKCMDKGAAGIVVKDISIAPFKEALLLNSEDADKYYRVKVKEPTVNENTGKIKNVTVCFLVRASSTRVAESVINEYYASTMIDMTVASIVETKIVGIIYDI